MTELEGRTHSRRIGLLVCLLAVGLMFGSCVPVGTAIYREVEKSSIASFAFQPGEAFDSGVVAVDAADRVEVAIAIDFFTSSVQERKDDFGDVHYEPRFQFPVDYEIGDAAGTTLYGDRKLLAWSGDVTLSNEQVDVGGGTASLHKTLQVLDVPRSGALQLTVRVDGDDKYGAEAKAISLELYADPPDWMRTALLSAAMFLVSVPLLILGLVLAFAGGARSGVPPGRETAKAARQMACACHLSGMAGYVVPFGSIIAPLVIWLMQRESDAFVEDQGREAVNFQISILIYSLASLVLMIVVVGFVLIFVLILLHIVLMIVAALRAYNGELYRYPLTIRFIR